jgi:hypothetical protein
MRASAHDMSPPEPEPGWITTVNWIATLAFAAVAIYWAHRWITRRKTNPMSPIAHLKRVQMLTQTFTAAGTALMFAGMV